MSNLFDYGKRLICWHDGVWLRNDTWTLNAWRIGYVPWLWLRGGFNDADEILLLPLFSCLCVCGRVQYLYLASVVHAFMGEWDGVMVCLYLACEWACLPRAYLHACVLTAAPNSLMDLPCPLCEGYFQLCVCVKCIPCVARLHCFVVSLVSCSDDGNKGLFIVW